jgi:hypothetical protein
MRFAQLYSALCASPLTGPPRARRSTRPDGRVSQRGRGDPDLKVLAARALSRRTVELPLVHPHFVNIPKAISRVNPCDRTS